MLTRTQILTTEHRVNEYQQKIHQTFSQREKSDAAWKEWEDACRAWHRSTFPTSFLWSDEHHDRVRSGDREAIEDTILYLETDPWYFRSGYLKERLLDALRQAPLTDEDKARLRKLILVIAAGRNRREFRRFCSLAKKITDEEFERTIAEKAGEHIAGNGGKFVYLFRYVVEGG